MKKYILWIMITLFLCTMVAAECPPDCDEVPEIQEPEVDWNDPSVYETMSPDSWDWSKVNYDLIDYTDPAVYSAIPQDLATYEKLDYTQLDYDNENLNYDLLDYSSTDYGKLDYTRVNYDEIASHSLVDSRKYLEDFGCYACSVNTDNFLSGELQYSKTGFIHPNGDSVSVPGEPAWPLTTTFTATEDEIIVHVRNIEHHNKMNPEEPFDIPLGDTVTLKTYETDLTLATGLQFEGTLRIEEGNYFIEGGEEVFINGKELSPEEGSLVQVHLDEPGTFHLTLSRTEDYGGLTVDQVRIDNTYSDEPISIYFDGMDHEESSYVALDPSGQKFHAQIADGAIIDFHQNNIFLQLDDTDFVTMELHGASATITSRDEQGYIPETIIVQHSDESYVSLNNGLVEIWNQQPQDTVHTNENVFYASPTPMTLELYQDTPTATSSLLFAEKDGELVDGQILMTNYNEFALLARGDEEGVTKYGTEVKTSLYYNYDPEYSREQLIANYGLPVSGEIDAAVAKSIDNGLQQLTEQQLSALSSITVLDEDEYNVLATKYGVPGSNALMTATGDMYMKDSKIVPTTVKHESTHALFIEEIHASAHAHAQSKYHKKHIPMEAEALDPYIEIAGGKNQFGTNAVYYDENTRSWQWKEGTPKYGFLRPYGALSPHEFVAVSAEASKQQVTALLAADDAQGVDTYHRLYTQLCSDGAWGGKQQADCYELGLLDSE